MPVRTRFSAPVQTGSGTQTATCTTGTGFFQGVKEPELVTDHPSASNVGSPPPVPADLCYVDISQQRNETWGKNVDWR
jgi:hypothetical protein